MEIRRTSISDLDKVMEIYDKARAYMRKNGNTKQWVNGYPSVELITEDIYDGKSYVCATVLQLLLD